MIPSARSTSLISTKLPYALLPILTSLLAGCGGGASSSDGPPTFAPTLPVSYEYSVPVAEDDGWAVSHLDDQDIDVVLITEMMDEILQLHVPGIDSVSIVRNNNLVLNIHARQE